MMRPSSLRSLDLSLALVAVTLSWVSSACGSSNADLCGDLVEDRATGSCRCPEGTTVGEDPWTCVLPDGGTLRNPNAPDASAHGGDDAGEARDSGVDAGPDDAGADDAGPEDAGPEDGGCPDRLWFRDRDRDGFGTDDDTVAACAMPEGYVAEGGDCDDACSACTPFASEICDERDNDCDESVDEGLPQVTCYRDEDGDGFGDELTTMMACGCPEGWTQRSDQFDCFDQNANVFPGQTEYFTRQYCAAAPGAVCARISPTVLAGGSWDYNCDGVGEARYRPSWAFSCGELTPGRCGGGIFWTQEQMEATCGTMLTPATCERIAGVCTTVESTSTVQACR